MQGNLVPAMWIAWGFFVVATIALYGYRSRIGRDEEGQIFLDEAFDHQKEVQAEILGKINRIQPAVRLSLVLAVVMSLVVIGYYAWYAAGSLFT